MIILVILAGLYLVTAVGYFKYAKRLATGTEGDLAQYMKEYPTLVNVLVSGMSVIWPVWIIGFLVKQAAV